MESLNGSTKNISAKLQSILGSIRLHWLECHIYMFLTLAHSLLNIITICHLTVQFTYVLYYIRAADGVCRYKEKSEQSLLAHPLEFQLGVMGEEQYIGGQKGASVVSISPLQHWGPQSEFPPGHHLHKVCMFFLCLLHTPQSYL